MELGADMSVDNDLDPKKRTVEMFHSQIEELNRDHIMESMEASGGSAH